MLKNRLISAAIVIGSTLLFVGLDIWKDFNCPGIWLLPLAFALFLGSAFECASMVRAALGPVIVPTLIGSGGIMVAACIPMIWPLLAGRNYPTDCSMGYFGWPASAAAIAQIASFAWYFSTFTTNSGTFVRAMVSGWIANYFGICFSFAVALRMMGSAGWGLFLLVGIILVTKCSDAGAYFSGRLAGRTKLCPKVSPNKTVEGLVGGMLIACLFAWLYFGIAGNAFFDDAVQVNIWGLLLLGILLTLVGLLGDLLESMFKREFGVKDSGNLLPGLGGLWDITDSLLPAFVVGYLLLQFGCVKYIGT